MGLRAMADSDTDERIDDYEELPKHRLWLMGAAVALLIVGLAIHATRSLQGNREPMHLLGFSNLGNVSQTCWVPGVYYANPALMPETPATQELTAMKCQERCQRKYGCLHFTYWPDGRCYLTSSVSKLKAAGLGFSETVSGPRDCSDLSHYTEEFLSGSVYCDEEEIFAGPTTGHQDCQRRCDNDKDCKWYSYWRTGWCRLTSHCQTVSAEFNEQVAVYRKVHAKLQEAGLKGSIKPRNIGAHGRECKAYGACQKVNITEGNCCPNNNRIHLRCCSATEKEVDKAVKEATKPLTPF